MKKKLNFLRTFLKEDLRLLRNVHKVLELFKIFMLSDTCFIFFCGYFYTFFMILMLNFILFHFNRNTFRRNFCDDKSDGFALVNEFNGKSFKLPYKNLLPEGLKGAH